MTEESSGEEAQPAKPAGNAFLDKFKGFDIKKIGGVEWDQSKVLYLMAMIGFFCLTLFLLAAFVAPFWERFVLILNHRFAMFCGFVACGAVLMGVPIKLGQVLKEKRDLTEIKGLPAWITLSAGWYIVLFILMQLLTAGGLPGLLSKRAAWLPGQVFGTESAITNIFSQSFGMGGVLGWHAPVKRDATAVSKLSAVLTTGTQEDLKKLLKEYPVLLRYRAEGEHNDAFKMVLSAQKPKLLEVFIKEIDIDATDAKGNGFLHLATERRSGAGPARMFKVLVDAGCDIEHKNEEGFTALHACTSGPRFILPIDYLLFKKANINATDNLGRTPLHLSAINREPEQVKLLIARGADVTIKDDAGLTPLEAAKAQLTEYCVKQKTTPDKAPAVYKTTIHYLEHVDDIKAHMAPSEWKALQSKKGTMWHYDPTSWNWLGTDLEFQFRLTKGEEVLKEQKIRVTPKGEKFVLHYSTQPPELKKLSSGASKILNDFIATLPKQNVPRTDPRWTANPDFDWVEAFDKK